MKICYLAFWDSVHTHRWLKYFADKGHEVHLISDNPRDCPELKDVILHDLSYRGEEKLRKYLNKIYFKIRMKRLNLLLKRIKPDILHSHVAPYWGWLGANTGFHPFAITAWGSIDTANHENSKRLKTEVEYALKKADLITSDSGDLRQETIKLGASSLNNYIVHWGVDLNKFNQFVDNSIVKKELNLSDGDPVIISVRQFRPLYNIDIIVRAFSVVLKEVPESKLILKNYQGYETRRINNLVKELKIEESVRFIEKVEYKEMPKYYRAADVFVSVPSFDSMSISLLEAMACGVIPVVSDLPATREWIKDGENGFLVPVRDVNALAASIIKALKKNKEINLIRERNWNLVKHGADYYKHMERMENLYYELLNRFENKSYEKYSSV